MGSVNPPMPSTSRNGLFVMALTVLLTAAIFLMLYRSRWGLQVRATVQNRVMAARWASIRARSTA
jgi:urea transport system permease protein